MNPQMARYLYNEVCAKGSGVAIDGEELCVTSPLWAAAVGAGVPPNLCTGHTKVPGAIEAHKKVAQFLRDWADAIEKGE